MGILLVERSTAGGQKSRVFAAKVQVAFNKGENKKNTPETTCIAVTEITL